MSEILENAWMGWSEYITPGKYSALLLLVFLYLIVSGRLQSAINKIKSDKKESKQIKFILYTLIISILCICPVSAAILMMYQTRFYDYLWIWTCVPSTGMIAYGLIIIFEDIYKIYREKKKKNWIYVGFIALFFCILILCGRMGSEVWDKTLNDEEIMETKEILLAIEERQMDKVCLWAPESIMENVRSLDGDITLPYGRNMWDKALDAYAYDTYSESIEGMYEWMEYMVTLSRMEEYMVGSKDFKLDEVMSNALARGVTCIVLPKSVPQHYLEDAEEELKKNGTVDKKSYNDYILFFIEQ